MVPTEAAENTIISAFRTFRIGFVAIVIGDPIKAPLANVAVHIVETPVVGKPIADIGGAHIFPIAVRVFDSSVIIIIAGELVQIFVFVFVAKVRAVVQSGGRSGPAGKFPLRFCWQVKIAERSCS